MSQPRGTAEQQPPHPAHPVIGQMLDGVHRVEHVLGRGSMGAVYAARNVQTGGMFAIKVLHPHAAEDQEIYARFRNEARVTSALRHPGIVQMFDFGQLPDGSPCIVMEYLEGEDLHQRLRRTGKLSLPEALRICRQVAEALHAAHKLEVVHRDLKPGNIFLTRTEAGEQAKIIDFGVSRIRGALAQDHQTQDMHIIGTPQYMSPEAALGRNSQLDGRSDQFSLAVILYRVLAGRLPFDGDNQVVVLHLIAYEPAPPIGQLVADLPVHICNAMERALSKRKEDRFATVLDFVDALEGWKPVDLAPLPTRVLVQSAMTPPPSEVTPVTPMTPLLSAELDPPTAARRLPAAARRGLLLSLAGGGLLGAAAILGVVWHRQPVATSGGQPVATPSVAPSRPPAPPAPAPPAPVVPESTPATTPAAVAPARQVPHGGHRVRKEVPRGTERQQRPKEIASPPPQPAGSQIQLRNPFGPAPSK